MSSLLTIALFVIASGAKQSTGTSGASRLLDRRVAALLAMTIPPERIPL
jgi:hypothetical protein